MIIEQFPPLRTKKLRIFRSWLVNNFPRFEQKKLKYFDRSFQKVLNVVKGTISPTLNEKTTHISIVASRRSSTWSVNNFPHFKRKKYEYFDCSFQKVLNVVGEQLPLLQTKNYEYFDRSFQKVLNVIIEQFPPLRTKKLRIFRSWLVNNFPRFEQKKLKYFDRSFQKVLNVVKGTISPTLNEKTTHISIVASRRSSTWSVNNFPHFKRKKYEYFDCSFQKVLNVVGEQLPLLQTKNYEYFDRSFQKVLDVVEGSISPLHNQQFQQSGWWFVDFFLL